MTPSCYSGNRAICLEYSPCLVLVRDNVAQGNKNSTDIVATNNVTENNASGSNTTTTETITALSIPAKNLTTLCSQATTYTLADLEECERLCQPGSCCNSQQEESSCYTDNLEICALYQPCINSANLTGGSLPGGNTEPPQDNSQTVQEELELPLAAAGILSTVCSYSSLASIAISGVECYELCMQASCCANGSCLNSGKFISQAIRDSVNEICETYAPCNNLNLLASPPSNLDEVCDDPTSDGCATVCS